VRYVRLIAVLTLLSSLAYTVLRWRAEVNWRPRQVLLITIDTLRADRLGCYGYSARATSPNIDALARQSVVFDRAYAAAPWTIPSLAALHTGRYPVEVGAYTNSDVLSADATTLAELFQRRGFATANFNTHALLVAERTGFRRGFSTVAPQHLVPLQQGEHKASFAQTEPALMTWLAEHAREPFFLWIHDMGPHLPVTAGNPYLTEPGWTRYDAEVKWTDELVGRVLRKLAAFGVGDDLLIVFTADHGEAFGDEHGLTGHQDVMYDEVLRVPLLIGAPKFQPRRVDAPVELVDVFSTIAALTDLPVPAGVRGESLVPLLDNTAPSRQRPYAFHMRFFFEADSRHWLAVRDRDWKLLAKVEDRGHDGPPGWRVDDPKTYFELYRVSDDPGEQRDLFDANPEQVSRLAGVLTEWTAALNRKPERQELDDATREHLRALGYE
jgi:arylsulfatase A-like enzyme